MHKVTGETKVAGIIGNPVAHSLSVPMQNAAFDYLNIDWAYFAFPVLDGEVAAALDGMRSLSIEGLNVTMPHKNTVAELVDELVGDASVLRTVNAIVLEDDALIGYTTDGDGFIDALADEKISVEGKKIVLAGAGGAAKAVAQAISRAGAEKISIVNRSDSHAQQLIAMVGGVTKLGSFADVESCDIVINATPIGMEGNNDDEFIESISEKLTDTHVAVDLIYHPAETVFLKAATRKNAKTIGGIGMLVNQAARSFKLWTRQDAPIDVMKRALDGKIEL